MTVQIITADVCDGLARLADESVHCCVTSPPYWGLRDYGTATWEGGISSCDHVSHTIRNGTGMAALGEKYRGGGKKATPEKPIQFADVCGKCGAARVDHQIGLEPTPEAFVARLVDVFREVRRVLRKDGTLFLNLGDSYATGTQASRGPTTTSGDKVPSGWANRSQPVRAGTPAGIKTKDLVGIPWMVAFSLRADGWYLRQEIIWAKPNPMPESVTDRCTKAHEHIFLLAKCDRYFYDAQAIRESAEKGYAGSEFNSGKTAEHQLGRASDKPRAGATAKIKVPGGWDRGEGGHGTIHRAGRTSAEYLEASVQPGRNKRSVWTIATQPFPEAHFATFPEELAETCIKAGCPAGGTVLDPFGGAGTTGLVADKLGRNAILIELNPAYAAMAERRIRDDCPMFAQVLP